MPAGFAFVYMRDYRDAEDAIRGLDRCFLDLLRICMSCNVKFNIVSSLEGLPRSMPSLQVCTWFKHAVQAGVWIQEAPPAR